MFRKFIVFIQLYWIRLLLISLVLFMVSWMTQFMIVSNQNYDQLESFSRRNISAQMGQSLIMFIFVTLIQVPLTFGFYYWMMSGGALGRMKTVDLKKAKVNVKMDDVIGMEGPKREAREIIKFLKDRELLKAVGGKNLKGALIVGPPGCGKTYLAKAIATECDLPFLSAVGSDFVGMYMGQGAARMKSLFKEARALANLQGGCIIFIDEIDSFARPRTIDVGFGGSISNNSTINQFLTELDGLRKQENNIVVIAATNAAPEQLDSAVTRSGRFDRKIYVFKPTAAEREQLLKFYLKKVSVDADVDIKKLAEKCQNFSPADISNMVREAGVLSIRHNRSKVNLSDLMEAMKDLLFTIEKMGQNKILSDKVNVHWDDVIGISETKAEAWEAVKLLKDRNMLKATGGRIIKGMVMFGPPGCGKTYLAKAIATEVGFPFMTVSCTELVGIFVGEGAKKIKEVFGEARELAKGEGGCIIFLDEIDAFATPRWVAQDHGASTSHNATVNQFLMELDGLRQEENNIFVLGATNVKESDIDPAILRPGRLERKLYFQKPNLEDRKQLFVYYLNKVKYDPNINVNLLASMTVGMTPADVESMVREASLLALREQRDTIELKDMSESYDRLTMGALSTQKYNEKERTVTAYHEAGHAILTYIYHPTDDVVKATIRPRKNALGYIYNRPVEELQIGAPNKEHLLAEIKINIAGYVAEKVVFGTTTAGVSSDFQQIMRIAHGMVWCLGMGKSGLLGNFLTPISHQGIPHMSERTKEILDQDVQEILQSCMKETTDTLVKHRDLLEHFTQELLKKGDLQHDEIQAIFQKFGLKPAYRPNTTPDKTA